MAYDRNGLYISPKSGAHEQKHSLSYCDSLNLVDHFASRPQLQAPRYHKRRHKLSGSTSSVSTTLGRPSRTSLDGLGPVSPFLITPSPPTMPTHVSKSNSSPLLSTPHRSDPLARVQPDSDDDEDDDQMLYTSWQGSGGNVKATSTLRTRLFGSLSPYGASKGRDKPICTTRGKDGAGETETEIDEPPRHLPTARIIPSSGPLIPPNDLQQRLTPLLFEFSRLLSIVPALFGILYNIYCMYQPPDSVPINGRRPPERIDYFVSALWAILTGYQCLSLTTGLLTRWRLYYPPLPTLIRLLALQAICWPATHLTLTILEAEKRPVIVWALVGSTTCMSRSAQIWVTSNLWWEPREPKDSKEDNSHKGGYWKRWRGGKWGGRRWDWREVGVKCVLPAGVVYCVMAWCEQLRREWSPC